MFVVYFDICSHYVVYHCMTTTTTTAAIITFTYPMKIITLSVHVLYVLLPLPILNAYIPISTKSKPNFQLKLSQTVNSNTDTFSKNKNSEELFNLFLYQGNLEKAEEIILLNDEVFEPTLAQRTMLMNGFVKQAKLDRAYANFARMKAPDVTAFNSIIYGLASHNEAEKAEILLRRMEEQRFAVKKNLDDNENSCDDNENPDSLNQSQLLVMPNEFSYKPVLHAHLYSGASDGMERSLALLYRMEDFHARGLHDFKPELDLYNMVLNAMGKQRDGNGAIELLEHMIQGVYTPRPNEVSFNCAISAQTDDTKASALLARMEEMNAANSIGSNVPKVQPNAFTFGALIDVHARRGLPLKAESVLQYMQEQYNETKSENFLPNTIHFNSVIDAWVRSKDSRGGKKAELILKRMLKENSYSAQPDLLTISMVMRGNALKFISLILLYFQFLSYLGIKFHIYSTW